MKDLADQMEEIEGTEILSIGNALELIKDLGDAADVSGAYDLGGFRGTHGIGHTRMATESDVDIRSAHPYWAYPYNDIAVVHNGQITNYWLMRRQLERSGQRFVSNCDSELLAVYTAVNLEKGMTLEDSLERSIHEIDGVFTYLITTRNELGMAKDTMAAKPMVLYEADDMVALASEEVAIRAIIPHEIDTTDPYDEEVGYGRRERLRLHADGHAYRAPDGPGHQDQVHARERRRFRLPLRAGRRLQPARRDRLRRAGADGNQPENPRPDGQPVTAASCSATRAPSIR